MGISDSNPFSQGVYTAVKGALGLFGTTNKTPSTGEQSVTPADEYESNYSNEDIAKLTQQWRKDYAAYYTDIKSTVDQMFAYWIGKQKTSAIDEIEGTNVVDNLIFEALETFLPIATRSNPEPLVTCDNTAEGQELAKDIKDALVYEADMQKLRMKLKGAVRNWALARLGAIEVSYDYQTQRIKTEVINPKRLLLDPTGHIDESACFTGDWIGVRHDFSASKLEAMFPSMKEKIAEKAKDKKGTKLEIIKWWYRGTDVFFTLDNEVLAKKKNPYWNYDGEIEIPDVETGATIKVPIEGRNHLEVPTAPLRFLGVFKTGLQPHDDTGLILQNLGIQDQVNKRYRQLDKNIDSQNNGMIVDGNKMTQEQAAEAASALRRGASIRVMGNVNDVVKLGAMPQLPSDVWIALRDNREQLKNIFGISGATPSGIAKEETARGKILVNQLDSSRIGGGITEYIEQLADAIYNLYVQVMFVHYDDDHIIHTIGADKGARLIALRNSRFTKPLVVTVKEGSLIPKDPLTQRNEAIDLWSANAIDPITLYQKLDYPDPKEAAKQLLMWQMVQKGAIPPQAYIPDFQAPMASPLQMPGGPGFQPLGQEGATTPTDPATQQAVGQQSKQLLGAVPLQ